MEFVQIRGTTTKKNRSEPKELTGLMRHHQTNTYLFYRVPEGEERDKAYSKKNEWKIWKKQISRPRGPKNSKKGESKVTCIEIHYNCQKLKTRSSWKHQEKSNLLLKLLADSSLETAGWKGVNTIFKTLKEKNKPTKNTLPINVFFRIEGV